MDQVTLASTLQMALSAHQQERKAGEERLKQFQHVPGHLVGLMQIVVRIDVDLAIRQIASIYFKNLVSRDWQPDGKVEVFSSTDKSMVRENLLEAIICAPPAIRSQLQECLKTVVNADYPETWPNLLPLVDQNLKSRDQQRTYGALVALRALARKYEFKSEEERAHLTTIVDTTFPILLDILKYLIALPNAGSEIADLIKLICKIFSSATYLEVPKLLHDEAVFLAWMSCLLALVERPVPLEGQPAEPEHRKSFCWWKVKKWALSCVNRLFNRFGDPKMFKGELKEFALMFQRSQAASRFLQAYLHLLGTLQSGSYLPDRIINLALHYLTTCVTKSAPYAALKPHLPVLVYEIVVPLMCFSDQDEQLWREDPHEYVRKGYDMFEDLYSPKTAAVNFIVELVRKRSKDNLDPFVQAMVAMFNRYEEAPADQKPYRQKDGAMLAVGALSEKLKKSEPYNSQLETMLARYVFPEFRSPMGFLRAKAAWVAGMYADIEFKDSRNFSGAMASIVHALRDPELPVRVDSVVALRSFVEEVRELDELRGILPQLLDEFFKLMKEVDNEDLVFTLETIVDKFGEEIAPYALGLVTNLSQAFWKCMMLADGEEEDGDSGALAAIGCLRAIGTILESISSLPHLFPQLEPTLLPIMHRMLTQDGQDVFEEVLEIVSYYTYFSPTISPHMWTVWPLIINAVNEWAIDFFENILGPLDNFIARGTEHFLTCKEPNYQDSLYQTVHKLLSDEKLSDEDVEPAPKLMETVLQNCRGRVDGWVEPYIQLAVTRLRKADKNYLKDLLMEVVANALYYNATLSLAALQKLGCLSEVFQLWLQMLYASHKNGKPVHFRREHDKKVCILGLSSLLLVPVGTLPGEVQGGLSQVMRALLKLLVAFKEQQEANAKLEEVEDDDEEIDDDDDTWGEDDDEEDEEGTDSKATVLAKKASKWLGEEEDDSDDEWTDDEEYQCPIDDVDPFIFFADAMKAVSAADPQRFQGLTGGLDFQHQAMVHGVAQQAEERRKEKEKEAAEKALEAAKTSQNGPS